MQILAVENGVEPNQESKLKRFVFCIPIGIMLLLQLITLTLFIYAFVQLSVIKTSVEPTINALHHLNITRISETIRYIDNVIEIAKEEIAPQYNLLKPLLKRLPEFINETENFIRQISKYLPHQQNVTFYFSNAATT